jgi:hypothetical protein
MATSRMTSLSRGPVVAVAVAALTFAASGVARATPTTIEARAADVAVELTADPPIVAVNGGTVITATVRNLGGRPARHLQLEIALPPEFQVFTTTSSSDLPCTPTLQVVTCTGTTDLAPNTTAFPVTLDLTAVAPAGTAGDFNASVTTRSRESDRSNNTASATVQIVGTGTVGGNVWNDLDGDGQRDPGEPPLNDIRSIRVINPDDGDGQGFSNIFNGFYSFFGVRAIPNIVRVELDAAGPWTFTTPNVGDDATDSDVAQVSATTSLITGESAVFDVTEGGVVTIDVGLVAKPQ